MALYAIGDLQGCYDPFRRLLEAIDFDPGNDTLWLTGDLVNRGPKSLKTLRFVKSLGDGALAVFDERRRSALWRVRGSSRAPRAGLELQAAERVPQFEALNLGTYSDQSPWTDGAC